MAKTGAVKKAATKPKRLTLKKEVLADLTPKDARVDEVRGGPNHMATGRC